MSMRSVLGRVFGGADRAGYLIRNAGPGTPIPTAIKVYVGPPRAAPLEDLVARRRGLAVKLPQFAPDAPKVVSAINKARASYGEEAARITAERLAAKHAELAVMIAGLDHSIAERRRQMGI